jgi:hypothetical protein
MEVIMAAPIDNNALTSSSSSSSTVSQVELQQEILQQQQVAADIKKAEIQAASNDPSVAARNRAARNVKDKV